MTLRVAVILGPTATGKTRLAVELAHRVGSEILSADSRQVYVGLDLGTGKDLEEYRRVVPPISYHLIDVCDPRRTYTLFEYQQDCYRVLRRLAEQPRFGSGEVPLLLVGGSGLYVEAVLRGYRIADVPASEDLRRRLLWRPRAELVGRLQRDHPELASTTDLSSTKRVVRALEIGESSRTDPVRYGEPLGIPVVFTVFGVRVERPELLRRIADRVERRLELGMVEEVRRLMSGGLPSERLQMLGMEYREIARHLRGETSHERMVADLKRRIGQLAKRQVTYFRGMERRGIPIRWIGPGDWQAVLSQLGRGQ